MIKVSSTIIIVMSSHISYGTLTLVKISGGTGSVGTTRIMQLFCTSHCHLNMIG